MIIVTGKKFEAHKDYDVGFGFKLEDGKLTPFVIIKGEETPCKRITIKRTKYGYQVEAELIGG